MRFIFKTFIVVLLLVTTFFYVYPLIEATLEAISSFEVSKAWFEELYTDLRVIMLFRSDLLMIMIFKVLCLIALKKNKV